MAVTCTLVADGSSDRVLIPLLEMLLDEHCPGPYRPPHLVELPAGLSLIERIKQALDLYPCDLLFVHRDAEKESSASRAAEIRHALEEIERCPSSMLIVPVRMTESWLLVEEKAIRAAAGNPSGKTPLGLPAITKLESLPNPKQVLFDALRTASELPASRLRKFYPEEKRHGVTAQMDVDSLARLRRLPSFQHLEHQIQQHFTA
ncbi:hypothetical protein [uncultured Sphaerotilus sp.]|uniref:hypothetical protein n=1 Tax=uncultured Sphaerotilus sp. TaxID=474984 RepID=UPI0030CA54F0